MKTWLRRLDASWMPETPAERLAAIRILVGLYGVVFLIARAGHLTNFARLSRDHFDPVGVAVLLPAPQLPWATYTLVAATIVASIAFLLGFAHRITGPLYAGLLLWVITYANSFGKILHTDNLFVIHVAVLGLTRSADAWSLDARRRPGPPAAHARYGWPIRLMAALCVAGYFLAGIAKLRNSGIDFVLEGTLRNYVAFDNVRKIELGSIHSPIGAWLLPFGGFFTFLAGLSFVLELGAPLALVHRRLGVVWSLAVWGFHIGVLALMAITFPYQLTAVAFAPFFRAEKLVAAVRARTVDRARGRRVVGSRA